MRKDVMWNTDCGPIVGEIKHGKRYENGNVTEKQYSQDKDNLSGILESLNSRIAKLELPQFSITAFLANPIICEMGKSETVLLSWRIVGEYKDIYVNGERFTGAGTELAVTNVKGDREFTLSVTGLDGEVKFAKTHVTFANLYYWGTSSSPEFTEANVKSLANSKISNIHENDFVINANNEHIFIAYPIRLGDSDISCGGIEGGFTEHQIVKMVNYYGYAENYYVYRSANKITGSFNISVR